MIYLHAKLFLRHFCLQIGPPMRAPRTFIIRSASAGGTSGETASSGSVKDYTTPLLLCNKISLYCLLNQNYSCVQFI